MVVSKSELFKTTGRRGVIDVVLPSEFVRKLHEAIAGYEPEASAVSLFGWWYPPGDASGQPLAIS